VRDSGGNSSDEWSLPARQNPGAGRSGWSIKKDITPDNLELIIEDTEDLFT
jgi:hypothetical protein